MATDKLCPYNNRCAKSINSPSHLVSKYVPSLAPVGHDNWSTSSLNHPLTIKSALSDSRTGELRAGKDKLNTLALAPESLVAFKTDPQPLAHVRFGSLADMTN